MKPRIGVTSTQTVHDDRPVAEVTLAFTRAVARAGAIPLVLPVLDGADAHQALVGLDGLLLTGGGDVAAWCYGQDQGPVAYNVDPARDAWELSLVTAAHDAGLPILGTCRGAQLLNVAAGGTLVQDLAAEGGIVHRVCDRVYEAVHPVAVDPASTLATITVDAAFGVNSLHHQAIDRVGEGLRPVAWAPDGVIEAIEGVDGLPVLGVQWHPELLADAVHLRLFDWLVQWGRRGDSAGAVKLVDDVA